MFEFVFAGPPAPSRRSIAGPLAIALHGLTIGFLVAASAWKVGDRPEPNVPIVFAAPAARPAPMGTANGAERPAARPARPASVPVPARPPAPVSIALAPVPVRPIFPVAPGPGEEGLDGEEHGSPDGLPGAIDSGGWKPSGGVGVLSAEAPNVVPPRILSQPQPAYPETARRMREQGLVVLQAVIGTDGEVEDVRVLSSTSALFDDPAVRAVRAWRYAPATLDRRAVRVYLTVTIRFTLH